MTKLYIFLFSCFWASHSYAGIKISGSLSPSVFSFRALDHEDTPNYYSVAPGFNFGFAYNQSLDLSLFVRYYPSTYRRVSLQEDISLLYYGAQISAWLHEEVQLGIKAGRGQYQFFRSETENEVLGRWQGAGGSVFLGTIFKITKSQFVEISLEYTQFRLNPGRASTESQKRTADLVSLNFGYTFSQFVRYLLENSLFRSVFSG